MCELLVWVVWVYWLVVVVLWELLDCEWNGLFVSFDGICEEIVVFLCVVWFMFEVMGLVLLVFEWLQQVVDYSIVFGGVDMLELFVQDGFVCLCCIYGDYYQF